jgi:hypothetical protein
MNPTEKDPLQRKLEIQNWFFLGILLLISLFVSKMFILGVFCGGILSIVNHYWRNRSLKKAFLNVSDKTKSFLMIRYYIRFILTGIVLYVLIAKTPVSVIGLIVGLSVVVINIVFTTLFELAKKNLILRTREVN